MTPTIGIALHPRRDPGEVATSLLEWARAQDDGVVQAALAVGGQRLGRYRCDGIVVATCPSCRISCAICAPRPNHAPSASTRP